MLQIYVTCGRWRLYDKKEWGFIVDEEKRGRLVTLQSTTSLEELKLMVLEDYGIEQSEVDVEFSFLPIYISVDSPPVVMLNDRQLKNFVLYFKKNNNLRLCVTFKGRLDAGEHFDLNKETSDDVMEASDHAKEPSNDVNKRRYDRRSAYAEDDGNVGWKLAILGNADKPSYDDAKVVDGIVSKYESQQK